MKGSADPDLGKNRTYGEGVVKAEDKEYVASPPPS
jgi:hypothetical protein